MKAMSSGSGSYDDIPTIHHCVSQRFVRVFDICTIVAGAACKLRWEENPDNNYMTCLALNSDLNTSLDNIYEQCDVSGVNVQVSDSGAVQEV